MTVVTTAPTYLFWRCAPPELRVPRTFLRALGERGGRTVAVGPHGSVDPARRLCASWASMWWCAANARKSSPPWPMPDDRSQCPVARLSRRRLDHVHRRPRRRRGSSICRRCAGRTTGSRGTSTITIASTPRRTGRAPRSRRRAAAPTLQLLRQDRLPRPYRRRDCRSLLDEIDGLIAQGVALCLFHRRNLPAAAAAAGGAAQRDVKFGVQTRIDLWKPEMLDLLGAAPAASRSRPASKA